MPPQRHAQDQHAADHQRRAGAREPRIAPGAQHAGRHRSGEHDSGAPQVGIAAEGGEPARIVEQRRDRDDRHHRLGADQRHQHQRHQRAGAVARHAADDGSKQRNARDQRELQQRHVGKAGQDVHAVTRPAISPPRRRWRRARRGRTEIPPRSRPVSAARQRRAERRALLDAALDEVRRLQRKHRRGPARGQGRQRAPGLVVRRSLASAPSQQRVIGEMLGPQPIEQRARAGSPIAGRNPPPALRHRGQPLVLVIGQPQLLPQPLGILRHRHARARRAGAPGRAPAPIAASTLAMFSKLAR